MGTKDLFKVLWKIIVVLSTQKQRWNFHDFQVERLTFEVSYFLTIFQTTNRCHSENKSEADREG